MSEKMCGCCRYLYGNVLPMRCMITNEKRALFLCCEYWQPRVRCKSDNDE